MTSHKLLFIIRHLFTLWAPPPTNIPYKKKKSLMLKPSTGINKHAQILYQIIIYVHTDNTLSKIIIVIFIK